MVIEIEYYKGDILLYGQKISFKEFKKQIEEAGLVFSGTSPDGLLAEMIEYPKNDWFVASQFHPEFKSRPEEPHPLFLGLISAAVGQKNKAKQLKIEEAAVK